MITKQNLVIKHGFQLTVHLQTYLAALFLIFKGMSTSSPRFLSRTDRSVRNAWTFVRCVISFAFFLRLWISLTSKINWSLKTLEFDVLRQVVIQDPLPLSAVISSCRILNFLDPTERAQCVVRKFAGIELQKHLSGKQFSVIKTKIELENPHEIMQIEITTNKLSCRCDYCITVALKQEREFRTLDCVWNSITNRLNILLVIFIIM